MRKKRSQSQNPGNQDLVKITLKKTIENITSSKFKVQRSKFKVQNSKFKVQSSKYGIASTY